MQSGQQSERQSGGLAPRVTLDDLRVEHVGPDYHAWLNDPEVMQFTEARFRQHTLDDIRAYVEETNASETDRIWRILCDERHVGNIKLTGINVRHRRAGMSILVGDRGVWGQGVATQAIRLATAESFKRYDLFKIFAGIYATNVASIRAFAKAGYVVEATLRGHRCLNGRMVDEVLMARFQPEAK
jgi:RimJ/RimL family protein N-acetyltransferase